MKAVKDEYIKVYIGGLCGSGSLSEKYQQLYLIWY